MALVDKLEMKLRTRKLLLLLLVVYTDYLSMSNATSESRVIVIRM